LGKWDATIGEKNRVFIIYPELNRVRGACEVFEGYKFDGRARLEKYKGCMTLIGWTTSNGAKWNLCVNLTSDGEGLYGYGFSTTPLGVLYRQDVIMKKRPIGSPDRA
jgi:hypothetical protein